MFRTLLLRREIILANVVVNDLGITIFVQTECIIMALRAYFAKHPKSEANSVDCTVLNRYRVCGQFAERFFFFTK